MKVISFSYKHSDPPKGEDWVVLDCRGLQNPHSNPGMRELTGKDARVQQWIIRRSMGQVTQLLSRGREALNAGKNVAYGCYGGRHRSVALAEMLTASATGWDSISHTALPEA